MDCAEGLQHTIKDSMHGALLVAGLLRVRIGNPLSESLVGFSLGGRKCRDTVIANNLAV